MRPNVASLIRLMLVTDDQLLGGRDLIAVARAAERGGVTSIQVRLKHLAARELADLVRTLITAVQIPILVNDRPDVALAAGAAGTHLGPDDLPVQLARRIAPPGFLIGASVGSEVEAAAATDADYWGIGPWRITATKGDAGPPLGAAGFRRLVQLGGARACIAIGSVTVDDVGSVAAGGGRGVAVSAGILAAPDVEAAARSYAAAVASAFPA
jgi:thiamine-phosphate pyrophosphorylase